MSSILNGKKLAVIGDPIEHSLSPLIQQAMLDELGLYCTYGRILVPAGTVAAWLPGAPGMNLAGFNATMPHKTDLVPLMNTLSDDARMYPLREHRGYPRRTFSRSQHRRRGIPQLPAQ